MSYVPFGRRYVVATTDLGFNPLNNTGNPTAVFNPGDLNLPQGQFEISKIAVTGGTPGSGLATYIDTYKIDGTTLDSLGAAHWYKASDGEFIVTNQSTVYFYFMPASGSNSTLLPTVTLWLTYDPLLPHNRGVFSAQGASQ